MSPGSALEERAGFFAGFGDVKCRGGGQQGPRLSS